MSQTQTRSSLRIYPTPFKPTFLSIPPSPFSPLAPLTPISPPKVVQIALDSPLPQPIASAPDSPLSWMWQCHQCHRSYHLGATRRCLDDGHKFCSGTTTIKAWRKPSPQRVKRHRACASEFDYSGWKARGRWRRGSSRSGVMKKKDCWNSCDYPSECRWGRKFGIHTPLTPTFPVSQPSPPPPSHPEEGILKPEIRQSESGKAEFWDALIANAKRRKSATGNSPLAEEVKAENNSLSKDYHSDRGEASSDQAPVVESSVIGMLTKFMTRNILKREKGDRQVPKAETTMDTKSDAEPSDPEALLDEYFTPLERVWSRREGA